MEALCRPSDLLLLPPISSQIERAWHLFTVLLRVGRPSHPAEFAERCAIFPSPSPDFVEFLCRIPGSPLCLTDDHFVTVSETAIAVFGRFLSSALAPFVPRVAVRVSEQRRRCGDVSLMYVRKRKLRDVEGQVMHVPRAKRRLSMTSDRDVNEFKEDVEIYYQLYSVNGTGITTDEVHSGVIECLQSNVMSFGTSSIGHPSCSSSRQNLLPSTSCLSTVSFSSTLHAKPSCLGDDESGKPHKNTSTILVQNNLLDARHHNDVSHDVEIMANVHESTVLETTKTIELEEGSPFQGCKAKGFTSCVEDLTKDCEHVHVRNALASLQTSISGIREEQNVNSNEEDNLIGCTTVPVGNAENADVFSCQAEEASCDPVALEKDDDTRQSLLTNPTASKFECSAIQQLILPTATCKEKGKSSLEPKMTEEPGLTVRLQNPEEGPTNLRIGDSLKDGLEKRVNKHPIMKQKTKRSNNCDMLPKEVKGHTGVKAPKSHAEPKLLPDFESFTIEEEEGSGGYGTVYRVRRKTDGKIFAVKCPHANAHSHHVNNEMKMLERFGGRNFVIKYEGSFKTVDSECFVLEHVEHDRPEVLKREINVFELQWYGYCMFRALASLHKQGIVHRDIKPGNFLFSRKLNKGYLIDFNLANDLHQKFFRENKSGTASNVNVDTASKSVLKFATGSQARRILADCILDNTNKEVASDPKKRLVSKKRSDMNPLDDLPKIEHKNKYGSQAADVSGVTSAKDATSTRTPSDRLKQPIPCKGRKELINFLHEAMQSPKHRAAAPPASQRKRVAAPLGKLDKRLLMLTPMPVHSSGNVVAGAGMFKSRGNGKQRREGPCVGTKGFRAPEVLFKSFHQGCKVDVWSAGVTLLYLMIGRTPFSGDPDQNVKEIAKLRGSEDLWEVAKLHGCESSFPSELFDVRSLQSMELREWCTVNTRRPEFLEMVPDSLFDLVDKCLTVNPRCRITAEEALMHDFFAPCHERLRKQRMLRRAAGSKPSCYSSH
ncbi:uncharacterized protein [Typha latifolia]|uniref:uncharacterized protein n=1 Tax=Typha latifolia TaxID=4733 RepID=UPI003C2F17B0